MPEINRISIEEALMEICGVVRWEDIREKDPLLELLTHLGVDERDYAEIGRQVRIAQSVFTRSEAELFGVSAPRFAYRFLLKDGGFINCRRIQALVRHLEDSGRLGMGTRRASLAEIHRHPDVAKAQKPLSQATLRAKLIDQTSSIADCLLAPPLLISGSDYHYATCDLFTAYGELPPPRAADGKRRRFTPYAQSVALGGGVCAQACCYMATAMLAAHASRICGLAEITSYAHRDRCLELDLSGLSPESMESYFGKVGLRMSQQAADFHVTPTRGERTLRRGTEMAIRAYLSANMPVVFPTDMKKLAKEPSWPRSVYSYNACQDAAQARFEPDENNAHAVVFVGFSAGRPHSRRPEDEYVFHDPSLKPYLRMPARFLFQVARDNVVSSPTSDRGVIMPVTPRRVRLPLLNQRFLDLADTARPYRVTLGLERIVDRIDHEVRHAPEEVSRTLPKHYGKLLVRAWQHRQSAVDPFLLARGEVPTEALVNLEPGQRVTLASRLADALQRLEWEDHWFWLESSRDLLWIWDAEQVPHEPARIGEPFARFLERYLRAIVFLDASTNDGPIARLILPSA
jgi:hypothetical protein